MRVNESEWIVAEEQAPDGLVIAVSRPSPYGCEHRQGLANRIAPDVELTPALKARVIAGLKADLLALSAGYGCCTACRPGAELDPEKAAAERERLAAGELAELSEELGLYGVPPQACMAHLRMVPCRKPGPHVLSSDPGDVARAAAFASGREERGDGALS